eukprot:COSAG01_NODE_24984_length_759_cov_1.642424_1_plen_101_part_00
MQPPKHEIGRRRAADMSASSGRVYDGEVVGGVPPRSASVQTVSRCPQPFWGARVVTRRPHRGRLVLRSTRDNPSARLIWSPQNSYLGDVFLGDAVVSVVW